MFGQRITELRKKNNFTQGQIAKLLKIPRSTYSNYELGNREPDFNTTEQLARLYEVSVDYLLGRSENKETAEQKSSTASLAEYIEMELTNEEILSRMNFTVDGMVLTEEESAEFVEFIRYRRFRRMQQATVSKEEGH